MTTFNTAQSINRDDWGRPLVTPPGGGKKTAYTRCTVFVDVLEDKYKLGQWLQRMVILGLVDREDLILSAAAHRDDKDKLNAIAVDAIEFAKAHAAATVGTAVHALAEQHDMGRALGTIPGNYRADLDAYVHETAGMQHQAIETFLVNDDLKVGGTPDRISTYRGRTYIADIKTGGLDYGRLKMAMQLALYAHSAVYNPATGERTPIDVDQDRGIIIHLPAGTGQCQLHWIDIAAGWEAVQLAAQVRSWRKRANLLTPIGAEKPAPPHDAVRDHVNQGHYGADELVRELPDLIRYADTVEQLTALWAVNQDVWTDAHTQAAAARKHVLTHTG